jgi:uncharacterized C2H2 Zn-finger protein
MLSFKDADDEELLQLADFIFTPPRCPRCGALMREEDRYPGDELFMASARYLLFRIFKLLKQLDPENADLWNVSGIVRSVAAFEQFIGKHEGMEEVKAVSSQFHKLPAESRAHTLESIRYALCHYDWKQIPMLKFGTAANKIHQ